MAVQTQEKVCHLNTNRMLSSSEDWRGAGSKPAASLSEHTLRHLVWGWQQRRSVHMNISVRAGANRNTGMSHENRCFTIFQFWPVFWLFRTILYRASQVVQLVIHTFEWVTNDSFVPSNKCQSYCATKNWSYRLSWMVLSDMECFGEDVPLL